MTRSLFFISLSSLLSFCYGQQIVVGNVFDQSSGEPIAGALILSRSDSTITDSSGFFKIQAIHGGFISVLSLGYGRNQITVNSDSLRIEINPSVLSLSEVMVSAGITQDRIKNMAASVNIVSKDMIQRDDPYTICNSINRIPGVYMHSGTYSTNRIIIRGIGSRSLFGTNKIKAYYDQIPLTDGSGNSTIEDLDQGIINRIEVLKGPNSSIYGAGLAGVVRLYSPSPTINSIFLESGFSLASYDTYRLTNKFSYDKNGNGITIVHSKTNSGGYRDNSNYNKNQVALIGRVQTGKASDLKVISAFTDLKAYIPSSINKDDYKNNPEVAAANWSQAKGHEDYQKVFSGISYTQELIKGSRLSASAFFTYQDSYEPRPFNILTEQTMSVGTRNVYSAEFDDKLQTSIGLELFCDIYDWGIFVNTAPTAGSSQGDRLSKNKEKRNYYNLFVEANYSITQKLSLVGGINLNNTRYKLTDLFEGDGQDLSGEYQFDPVISPRVGAVYHITKSNHLFTNISHGFSPPSLEETLYPDGQINPNVQPEKGWNFEVGLRGNLTHLSYDLVSYYMRIKDLLVAQRVAEDQYVGVNAGLNTHLGLDLLINYSIDLSENHLLNLFNSLSLMDYQFKTFVNEDQDYSGNQLTGVPQFIVNPVIEIISSLGVYGNINGNYVGQIPINDANSIYSDEYFVARLKAGYRVNTNHLKIDLYAGINNLFNEKYASMLLINATGFNGASPRYYYPSDPRNYFVGISLKYIMKKP